MIFFEGKQWLATIDFTPNHQCPVLGIGKTKGRASPAVCQQGKPRRFPLKLLRKAVPRAADAPLPRVMMDNPLPASPEPVL